MALYSVPWFVFQWRWPVSLRPFEHLPPVAVTLGLGVGWFVAMVLLLAIVVPGGLVRAGHVATAWRWRRGAIHAAWFGLVVTAGSAGMRLPLSPRIRVIATVALFAVEILALRWRRAERPVTSVARQSHRPDPCSRGRRQIAGRRQPGGLVGAHVETPAPTISAGVELTLVVTPVAGLYWNTSVDVPGPTKSQKSPPQNANAKLELPGA